MATGAQIETTEMKDDTDGIDDDYEDDFDSDAKEIEETKKANAAEQHSSSTSRMIDTASPSP